MQRRVMLWGLSGDPSLDSVRHELIRRDTPYVFLDQREIRSARLDFRIDDELSGQLTLGDESFDVREIGAIFVRPHDVLDVLRETPDASAAQEVMRTAVSLQQRLFAWADISDALVVNRPSATVSNSSKPYQGELIRRCGFAIPDTLVTTTPDDAREFIASHAQVVYKSVSDDRSMVSRVGEEELEAIGDVVNCPTQFQAHVAGTDWRVHVVGDELYACEIRCAADDYRWAEPQGIPIEIRAAVLPEPVAARCLALARMLNLPLSGIDLRRTEDDMWYCFEVNPAPAFTYYENATGQRLSAAVARLLSTAVDGLAA